jgi:hypothetical protein
MKKLKIMADYNSYGLWSPNFDIGIKELYNSLPEEIKQKIVLWIEKYSDQINWDNPGDKDWKNLKDPAFWKDLLLHEQSVVNLLKKELNGKYELQYIPTKPPKNLEMEKQKQLE